MTGPLRCHAQPVLGGEGDRRLHVLHRCRLEDRGGPLVHEQIPGAPSLVPAFVPGHGEDAEDIRDASREAIKRRMAILMIERGKKEVLTAPVIQDELGSRFQITGLFTPTETQNLSLLMHAGALAAPMEIVEERTVGPSLGKENIDKGFNSVLYGFIVLAIFICAYYELMGIISVISLAVNLLLLIAILSMLQATLTLPGIAAMALTLGMAIDANVLINERIREELRWGETPMRRSRPATSARGTRFSTPT